MTDNVQSNSDDITILGRQISEFPIINVGHVITSVIPNQGVQLKIINFETEELFSMAFPLGNDLQLAVNPDALVADKAMYNKFSFQHNYTLKNETPGHEPLISVGGSFEPMTDHTHILIYPFGFKAGAALEHFTWPNGKFYQLFSPKLNTAPEERTCTWYDAEGRTISEEECVPDWMDNHADIEAVDEVLPEIKPASPSPRTLRLD